MSASEVNVTMKFDDEFTAAAKRLGEAIGGALESMATMTLEAYLNAFLFNEHVQVCSKCHAADKAMPWDNPSTLEYWEAIHDDEEVGYCGFGKYLEMNELRRRTRGEG